MAGFASVQTKTSPVKMRSFFFYPFFFYSRAIYSFGNVDTLLYVQIAYAFTRMKW